MNETTIYAYDKSIDTVIVKLEDDLQKILDWFIENGMCPNPAEFQMMFLGLKINNLLCLNIDGQKIKQSVHVKLLGVQIDNKLNFNVHVKELCKKMNQKLCAFSRIRPFLKREKAKILLTSIVMSNLSYCPLIWIFCSKSASKEINRINKRALRVLYEDYDSSFEQLLEKDGSVTVHQRNLQNLMTEIFTTISQINPLYMWEFFVKKDMPYHLRTKVLCRLPHAQTNRCGLDSLSIRGSLLWNTLKDGVKRAVTLTKLEKLAQGATADTRNWNDLESSGDSECLQFVRSRVSRTTAEPRLSKKRKNPALKSGFFFPVTSQTRSFCAKPRPLGAPDPCSPDVC